MNHKLMVLALLLTGSVLLGNQCGLGLNPQAMSELQAAGLDKYLGDFTPAASVDVGDGWTKHTFDPDGGAGPICIAGTPFSAFTKAGNPHKLLFACWQNFYFCNILAEDQEPPPPPAGIWDSADPDNPFADYSIVYLPYCDGSVFSGDNDVVDANFPFGPVRFHRGLRNLSAGMDLAKATFPGAVKITLAGSSAGGVGVAGFAPFLARFSFGNFNRLTVFNDAGPVAINLNETAAIQARANDWQFGQFYPASCTECDDEGQATAAIEWRLDNDKSIREAFYETDGDATNRFFLNVPTQTQYRDLILTEHGALNAAYPLRYKRFIVSGDDSHTALQSPLLYTQEVDGTALHEWTDAFLNKPGLWRDTVEDFVPLP
jgi:hypothetical protein